MRHQSEVFTIFKQWKVQVENQTRRRVKYLRFDNRLEYKDTVFLEFCKTRYSLLHSERDSTAEWSCRKDEQNTIGKGEMYEVECRIAKEFLG